MALLLLEAKQHHVSIWVSWEKGEIYMCVYRQVSCVNGKDTTAFTLSSYLCVILECAQCVCLQHLFIPGCHMLPCPVADMPQG